MERGGGAVLVNVELAELFLWDHINNNICLSKWEQLGNNSSQNND